jgi:hypothetical protein
MQMSGCVGSAPECTCVDERDRLRLIVATMANQTHESYSRQEASVPGSDRSFGMVMAAAFAVVTLINFWRIGHAWPWTGAAAAMFFVFACLFPAALRPLNWTWFQFGLLLHKVVNPIVMALVFFGSVLPTGFIMRALGKDPLRLKRQPAAKSYWIERRPPGPAPESMKDQF